MIQVIVGPPRSGKSYMAVHYLLKYTKYDELYDCYELDKNVLVISNIAGLKIRHWEYPKCLKDISFDEFWTLDNFEAIQKKTGKSHIVVVLDEVHKIFPASFKGEKVYECLAEHGHIGLDVIFLTQGLQATSRFFLPLLEYVVFVQPRSRKLGKSFLYHYKSLDGKFLYPKMLPIKKDVFHAYKSRRTDEFNKPKSAVMFWAVASMCLFACAGGLFYYAVSGIKAKGQKPKLAAAAAADSSGFRKVSSVPPGTKKIPVPVSIPQPDPFTWETINISGYAKTNTGIWLLIGGKRVRYDERFRNLQTDFLTVERVSEVQPAQSVLDGRGRAERVAGPNGSAVQALAGT